MFEPTRKNFIKDGVVMQNWQFDPSWTKSRGLVYEVMRVLDGKPLFAQEHIDRLMQSAIKSGIKDVEGPDKIFDSIGKLIHSNTVEEGNIFFCLVRNKDKTHILSCFIQHHYPSSEEYEKGVYIRTMKAIRKNPNAKVWNAELRKQVEYLKASSDAYEVLLVDRKKNITEGSKSNIFFIRGNTIFTSPESKVLAGVTRLKVISLSQKMMIRITEKEIPLDELPYYEAAFLTGTSPRILPISQIDKVRFNTNCDLMRRLMTEFDKLILESIK